ncbi:MAG: oxidoreductase [Candidatus Thiodiazotropha sp.]
MKSDQFLQGLRELYDSSFPRKCPNCGREYPTLEAFLKETVKLEGRSGLTENLGCPDEGDEPIVELYRNCVCGSTMMEFFSNRRDTSEQGVRRRQLFKDLLKQMVVKGISEKEARKALLLMIRSNMRSQALENLGIHISIP